MILYRPLQVSSKDQIKSNHLFAMILSSIFPDNNVHSPLYMSAGVYVASNRRIARNKENESTYHRG